MSYTITFTGRLTSEECCGCGIVFAMPGDFMEQCRGNPGPQGKKFYCPNGHAQWYTGKTEAQKLREQLATVEQRAASRLAQLDQERASHQSTRNQLRSTKGVVTRTKRRVAHGVCPCCNRTFADVARHMVSKHPDYVKSAEPGVAS